MDSLGAFERGMRQAIRRLRRRPSRPLVTAFMLAVAIGATTSAFAVVDQLLRRDLPVEEQAELVIVWQVSDRTPLRIPFGSVAFDAVRQGTSSLSSVAGFSAWGTRPTLVRGPDDAFAMNGTHLAGDFFGVLNPAPAAGRLLTREDDVVGAAPVAVLSHGAWHAKFGADPGVIGSTLMVGETARTIVGVAPRGLDFPTGTEIWFPLAADYLDPAGPGIELHLVGRVAPGVDASMVEADIGAALRQDERAAEPAFISGRVVQSFEDAVVGPIRPLLHAGLIAALVLLIAATANATLFILADGRRTAQDMAVRRALGAERRHAVARLVADSAVVGTLALIGGLALAWLTLSVLTPIAPPELPRFETVGLDMRATALAVGVALLIAVVTGSVAGVVLSRLDTRSWLSSTGRRQLGSGSGLRQTIAGLQVSLTVVSAAGAGLLFRTVTALDRLDPGLSVSDITVVSLRSPYSIFQVPETYFTALEDVVLDLEARPGIVAARPSLTGPMQQGVEVALRATDQSDEAARSNPYVAVDAVLPGHFAAVGIPIVAGRGLTAADNRSDADPVVVVDEVLARALWPSEDAIGKRITGYPGLGEMTFTVAGVVGATRYREFFEPHPRAYFPARLLANSPPATLLVRTSDRDAPVLDLVRNAFTVADPLVQVLSAAPMSGELRRPTASRRFAAGILLPFAAATLLLALVGVHGVFTVAVHERTREMGVRRVLGAQRLGIVRMVLWAILRVAAVGAVVGLALSIWASRFVEVLLFGVTRTDPGTLTVVFLMSLGIALLAGLAPAWRASSIDPGVCLRSD